MSMFRSALLAASIVIVQSTGALAVPEDPVSLGTFEDWEAFTYQSNKKPVCYVYSTPRKTESSKRVKRDPVYVLISHYPGRKVKGQVSTIIGYPFKDSSKAKLYVDGKAYELYTNGDSAWIGLAEQEREVVNALRTGKKLQIAGTSWKGTDTVDTYSLSGFVDALKKIDQACR